MLVHLNSILITSESGTCPLTLSGYTKPEYRGNGLKRYLIMAHMEELIKHYPEVHKCQTHVFKNNEKSIKANEKAGFIVVKEFESIHPKTLDFFPDNTIMLLEKTF